MKLTKQALVRSAWEQLECDSAGDEEITFIREQMQELVGVTESPATVARLLADLGVPLRHPEILETDVRWREPWLSSLLSPEELSFDTVSNARETLDRFDALNRQFELEGDAEGVRRLREFVLEIKTELEGIARSPVETVWNRPVIAEVVEWLRVWLQNPLIFSEWLSLRLVSKGFIEKFGPR